MTERDAYADLGTTTQGTMDIAETSMDIVRTPAPGGTLNDRLQQKVVHLTGDIGFQYLIRCQNDPVVVGAGAILGEHPVVTDITMAKAGIIGHGHDCQVQKATGNGARLAAETGMTRTAAVVLELGKEGVYDGTTAVVGNVPTAVLALCDCIENGTQPAAAVAMLVGFVKAEESRGYVRDVTDEYGVPVVTNVGRHGKSGLVATLTNELIHIANDVCNGNVDLANHE